MVTLADLEDGLDSRIARWRRRQLIKRWLLVAGASFTLLVALVVTLASLA